MLVCDGSLIYLPNTSTVLLMDDDEVITGLLTKVENIQLKLFSGILMVKFAA